MMIGEGRVYSRSKLKDALGRVGSSRALWRPPGPPKPLKISKVAKQKPEAATELCYNAQQYFIT